MPTEFIKGSQTKYNSGIIRRSVEGQYVAELNRDGRRRRKTCSTEAKARKWIDQEKTRRNDQGKVAFQLQEREMREAANAMDLLRRKGYRTRLSEAVDFYIKHHPLDQKGVSLRALLEIYIEEMQNPMDGGDPCSPETVRTKRKRLQSFLEVHGDRDVREITETDVQKWVSSFGQLQSRTILNYRAELQSLFNFAEQKVPGYSNTVCKVKQRKKKAGAPVEILEPTVTEALLREFEKKRSKRYAVTFALMCFAGIRPDELLRSNTKSSVKSPLNWNGVDLENNLIHLRANQVKVGGWREVPIPENLKAWLECYPGEGRIAPSKSIFHEARREAMKMTGVSKWIPDICRHSYATYAGEIHGLHKVAGWMGHVGGLSVLNAHYKGRASKDAAHAYFTIVPRDG